MLIEDNDDIRKMVTVLLSREGYQVAPFSDGQDALDALSGGTHPSVILLDWRMPITSGKEFLERYQSLEVAKDLIPIYIFSAENDPRLIKETGCAGIIKKPVNITELFSTIDSLKHSSQHN